MEEYFTYPPFDNRTSIPASELKNHKTYFVRKTPGIKSVSFIIEEIQSKKIKSVWYKVSELDEAAVKSHKKQHYPDSRLIIEREISRTSSITFIYFNEAMPDMQIHSFDADGRIITEGVFDKEGKLLHYFQSWYTNSVLTKERYFHGESAWVISEEIH